MALEGLQPRSISQRINLVGRDDLGFRRERRAEGGEFTVDHLEIVSRITPRRLRDVDQMDQKPGPLHMPEELDPEPLTSMRALDQPRYVGQHERSKLAQIDDAEVRCERGKRVIGDFGARRRDARDQRRLAGVRKADDPGVGDHLQIEEQDALRAYGPRLRLARRLVRRGGEHRVAACATPPGGDHYFMLRRGQVGDEIGPFLGADHRAGRHADQEILPVAAGLVRTFSVAAAIRGEIPAVAEGVQPLDRGIAQQEDRPAGAAVPAVRAATRHEFLAPEADASIAPSATGDDDASVVDEHWTRIPLCGPEPRARPGAIAWGLRSGPEFRPWAVSMLRGQC